MHSVQSDNNTFVLRLHMIRKIPHPN